jgi:phage tail sheath gpL-like
VLVNNIPSATFTIAVDEVGTGLEARIADAINSNVDMPLIASADTGNNEVDLTSKWKGVSANDIKVEVVGPSLGITFAVTQLSGGLSNPSVSGPLALVGNVWETMFLNCLDIADTTALGLYKTFGDGRWGALVRKPCVVFTGNNATSVASATAVSDARPTDKVNAQLVSPGSKDLPFVIAARQLARIVVLADNNPPHDYGSQQATGLTPGADGDQWDFARRDAAVKAGSSTVEVRDGVVCVSDVVTFYHPDGDPTPAYRYVVDIVKLQNIIFNLDLEFNSDEWDGAPLLPDNQPTSNPTAKKPKTAKAAAAAIVDGLGMDAIISDPETTKASIQAGINSGNPKRLDLSLTVQLSGNTNQMAVDLNFGFFFGG